MEDLLRVDVGSRTASRTPVPERYRTAAGRNLIAKLLLDEVNPTCEPLGGNNKLIVAAGLLAGTAASSAGRLSLGGKSPLTGGIKESNAGGLTASRLAQLGIRAIVLEGLWDRKEWSLLLIDSGGARLLPANEYVGMGTHELCSHIREDRPHTAITCIGPGGEKLYNAAGVATTDRDGIPCRLSGRGGLGAVMGSKGIKAIVVDGRGRVPIAEEAVWKRALKEYNQLVKDAPTSESYREFGTAALLQTVNALSGLPVNNFSRGRFEGVDDISAERLVDNIEQRGGSGKRSHSCMPGCLIACSNIYVDEAGRPIVRALEYETIALMGSNLGIADLDAIAHMNYLCNDIGIDTMEMGAAIGVAMEAGVADFGDSEAAIGLLDEVRTGTVLGRVLGAGAAVAGKVLGVLNVPVVKGQSMAAYDPRAIKGMGVTYATSPMGADHTAGPTARAQVDHADPEGQPELSLKMQKLVSILDFTGLCMFTVGAIGTRLEIVADLIEGRFGWDVDADWLRSTAVEMVRDEHRFNELAGFTRHDDRLPEAFTIRELPELKTTFDVPEQELDEVSASFRDLP